MNMKQFFLRVILLLPVIPLSAQSASEKRSFYNSYPVNKDTKLEVINKYGDVKISVWDKDSIYILAEIEAFSPDEGKVRNMINGVETEFSGTSMLVSARTKIKEGIIDLTESFKGLTKKVINYESGVKISYYINAPAYTEVRIENQFGDISIEKNGNIVSATLSNGNFEAGSLNSLPLLKLSFAEAFISSVRSARMELSFSRVDVNESEELSINSTSSRIELEKAGIVATESRRDKFFTGQLDELKGISYFTDFRIEALNRGCDATIKYGSLDIASIRNDFRRTEIKSSYSDIYLNFNQSAAFDFEIRHVNSFVVIPEKNANSRKETVNKDKNEYIITGSVGNTAGAGKVVIDAVKGNIYIR